MPGSGDTAQSMRAERGGLQGGWLSAWLGELAYVYMVGRFSDGCTEKVTHVLGLLVKALKMSLFGSSLTWGPFSPVGQGCSGRSLLPSVWHCGTRAVTGEG